MKKKMLVIISSILIFLGVISFGKNLYFKNIIEKELSKSFKQDITIEKAYVNLISNTFILENTYFSKDDIIIKNIKTKMNFKDFLKNKKSFTVDSIIFKNIFFNQNINTTKLSIDKNNISLNDSKITNDKANQFISEIDRQIKGTKGLTTLFKSKFSNENFSQNTSQNLLQFFIENVDFIDVIIQREVNILLEKKIISFSQKSRNFISTLKNSKTSETEIFIKSIVFSGNADNISFNGEFKNINNNLSKNFSIPLNISLTEIDGKGKGQIYGNININKLDANIYIKLESFNVSSFKNINQYISEGIISSEQLLTINGTNINIDGTTNFNNIIFDKDFINKSNKLDHFKKVILNRLINLTQSQDYKLSISSNFSTVTDFVSIKTNLPAQIKRGLISERSTFISFLESELKTEYKNKIEDKKNKIKRFFKNIF
ncbi:MAG: hypothetical protein ACRC5W_02595 [Cetobacterium sp.]